MGTWNRVSRHHRPGFRLVSGLFSKAVWPNARLHRGRKFCHWVSFDRMHPKGKAREELLSGFPKTANRYAATAIPDATWLRRPPELAKGQTARGRQGRAMQGRFAANAKVRFHHLTGRANDYAP